MIHDKDPADLTREELRRDFLDSLSYLCDYDTGGNTVTAIAIENVPERPVFWIASNRDPNARVVRFLETTLRHLKDLDRASFDICEQIENTIFSEAIKLARPRLKDYVGFLRRRSDQVLELMKDQDLLSGVHT